MALTVSTMRQTLAAAFDCTEDGLRPTLDALADGGLIPMGDYAVLDAWDVAAVTLACPARVLRRRPVAAGRDRDDPRWQDRSRGRMPHLARDAATRNSRENPFIAARTMTPRKRVQGGSARFMYLALQRHRCGQAERAALPPTTWFAYPAGSLSESNKVKEQNIAPIWVRASRACKLGGWGLTKTSDLITQGHLKTVRVDGMTLVSVECIRFIGDPQPTRATGPLS